MKPILKHMAVGIVLAISLVSAGTSGAETIGVIFSADMPYYQDIHSALVSRLKAEGYGERLKFLIQKPYPDTVSWSNAARKLIAADVDIIVTYGFSASLAALRERPNIPIVYAGAFEPLTDGRAKNITGMYAKIPVSSVLRYLREAATVVNTLGVFYSSMEEDSVRQLDELQALSSKYGFEVQKFDVRRSADISSLLAGSKNKSDAFFLTSSVLVNNALSTILNTARNEKIPTGSLLPRGEIAALITLTANPNEQGHGAAGKLIEILNGKSAANIPSSHSKDIELIFNMKEAREMGIRIPIDLVTEATKILY
ncbi:MAG: ABC transporter substrate-binding protein [Thermodesulfovibrionales bacterium]|nr:ABC transporter substrate-binding protein [Thermodesulfovibrionales bacterium]